jgi:group I intron endonuclease
MNGIVYVVTNTANGSSYVGKTCRTLSRRWAEHCSGRTMRRYPLGRAIKKYGKIVFSVEPLARGLDAEEASLIERQWIAILKPAYNLTAGGDGTSGLVRGPFTAEHKAKLSAAHKGNNIGNTHTLGMKFPNRRKPPTYTAEHRANLSAAVRAAWSEGRRTHGAD